MRIRFNQERGAGDSALGFRSPRGVARICVWERVGVVRVEKIGRDGRSDEDPEFFEAYCHRRHQDYDSIKGRLLILVGFGGIHVASCILIVDWRTLFRTLPRSSSHEGLRATFLHNVSILIDDSTVPGHDTASTGGVRAQFLNLGQSVDCISE